MRVGIIGTIFFIVWGNYLWADTGEAILARASGQFCAGHLNGALLLVRQNEGTLSPLEAREFGLQIPAMRREEWRKLKTYFDSPEKLSHIDRLIAVEAMVIYGYSDEKKMLNLLDFTDGDLKIERTRSVLSANIEVAAGKSERGLSVLRDLADDKRNRYPKAIVSVISSSNMDGRAINARQLEGYKEYAETLSDDYPYKSYLKSWILLAENKYKFNENVLKLAEHSYHQCPFDQDIAIHYASALYTGNRIDDAKKVLLQFRDSDPEASDPNGDLMLAYIFRKQGALQEEGKALDRCKRSWFYMDKHMLGAVLEMYSKRQQDLESDMYRYRLLASIFGLLALVLVISKAFSLSAVRRK